MKTEKKKPRGRYRRALLLALVLGPVFAPAVKADDIAFKVGRHSIIIPFKQVSATELYSFREGKGFPALESVVFLSHRKKFQGTIGAAAELGASKAVPFLGANWRLPESLFDLKNNQFYFGAAIAKRFDDDPKYKSWRGIEVTLKASHALW